LVYAPECNRAFDLSLNAGTAHKLEEDEEDCGCDNEDAEESKRRAKESFPFLYAPAHWVNDSGPEKIGVKHFILV